MTPLRRPLVLLGALVAALSTSVAVPGPASAHPLGNFTVNRALAITVSDVVAVTGILDLAEIPAYETIRDLDIDGDDAVSAAEEDPWAADTCAAWRGRIDAAVDGRPIALEMAAGPELTFPGGAGGLPTLRLVCRWELPAPGAGSHRLTLDDATEDDRIGWREVTATAGGSATISASDVPAESDSGFLTRYPEDRLASPPEVRSATMTFTLGGDPGAGGGPPDPIGVGPEAPGDPLAALVGGELSPFVVLLALLLSAGLGAAHALSPGHGKTLVAAYVLGAGGTARAAVQIGLWVAISHTAGVLVLGIVTLGASEWLLPEQLIAWLSLGSGIIVTGLGLVLLVRVLAAARRRRVGAAGHHHPHPHPHDHGHGHDHEHGHTHPHTHEIPAPGELSWRTAIALGFAGGAVPSASALIVLLVAISTDRLVLGVVLIGAFGIGMAAVLGGLAYAIARMRHLASQDGFLASRPIVARLAAMAPVAAGLVVLATGVAFTAVAVGRLA